MPLGTVTENNDRREMDLGAIVSFFSELLFEVGGRFLPRVLNEPFVYVLLLCKSLSASKSSILPPYNNRRLCQCANMTRIQS